MVVEIDRHSGFCFGVQNAVEIAEKALEGGEKVYSLGPIVHNDREVERLSKLGLISVGHDEYKKLSNCKVLIRAHGEPPETYSIALRNNITIIEATCPIVKKLQSRIKNAWHESRENNGQVVIYGKKNHAEVVGLLGQIENEGILITDPSDLEKVDFKRPVSLFSQTTMGVKDYSIIGDMIRSKIEENGITVSEEVFKTNRTICGQVSNREPHMKAFAAKHDVIIFVSGRESSNGKMLYSVCKAVNDDTYFISSTDEIDTSWFNGKKSVGVCGATSTPRWLIEKTRDFISNI